MTVKTILAGGTALALLATAAHAGGLDRSRLAYAALFESGRYVELGFSNVTPSVSGTYTPQTIGAAGLFGGGNAANTGNMAESYQTFSFAYKADINDNLSYAILVNTPYGASAAYTAGLYTGLQATWESRQVAALLKYETEMGFSVYGGARYLESSARIELPDSLIRAGAFAAAVRAGQPTTSITNAPPGTFAYSARGDRNGQVGMIVGAAYERPDIALRIGLTYEQGVTHDFATTETLRLASAVNVAGTTNVEIPDAFTLDFQSGIAKDTLLFGSVRYVEWSNWEVRPPVYEGAFDDNVTDFDNNVTTWQLGIGRRLSDNLSVFARATYEKANGGISSRLAPTDGTRGIGFGATWRQDNVKVTGGIEYAKVGDAVDGSGTRFEGNDAVGVGISFGYSF